MSTKVVTDRSYRWVLTCDDITDKWWLTADGLVFARGDEHDERHDMAEALMDSLEFAAP